MLWAGNPGAVFGNVAPGLRLQNQALSLGVISDWKETYLGWLKAKD